MKGYAMGWACGLRMVGLGLQVGLMGCEWLAWACGLKGYAMGWACGKVKKVVRR
jgi:hypothetical protein